jgi:hypothetical protein
MPRTEFIRRDIVVEIGPASQDIPAIQQEIRLQEREVGFGDLNRLVLKIANADLASRPWEKLLDFAGRTIIRASSVRPRFLNTALKLPLRILHLNPLSDHRVSDWVLSVFGSHPPENVAKAVMVSASETWATPEGWPLVDILHLDRFPASPTELLSTADPDQPGTLGWYSRWTNKWQTRLMILNCETSGEAEQARRLAYALCERAGPAVIVVEDDHADFYQRFYDQLVHDFPLDSAAAGQTLFLGEGREDGVRVSNVAVAIIDLAEQPPPPAVRRPFPFVRLLGQKAELAAFRQKYEGWEFDFHERDGLLPMSREIEGLRRSLRQRRWATQKLARVRPRPAKERYLNSACWRQIGAQFTRVPPEEGVLQPGALYCLGLQIGANDLVGRALDARAVLEEIFSWAPDETGVWVELAVVGIDFQVVGDPVQELWLPRTGETDTAFFTVIPPANREVATLRYGLYYKNNLIQSFRLAAFVGSPQSERDSKLTAEKLGLALGVDSSRVGTALYRARMEYSRTSAFNQLDAKSEPAITITANNLEGKDIITVKGPNVLDTRVYPDGEMPNIVKSIRNVLDEVGSGPKGARSYQFGKYEPEIESRLKGALIKLADVGNRLYLNLLPQPESRQSVADALADEGRVIHVAELLRDKVIPWSIVYDREFDSLNAPLACLAALPDTSSALRANQCGTHPECLLHHSVQPPNDPKDVACPLHFWGFRHIIEIPPQQVVEDGNSREEVTCIKPKAAIQVAVGLNGALPTCPDHWTSLSKGRSWGEPMYSRADILKELQNQELDVIYFFCHARGGEMEEPRTDPPFLEFQISDAAQAQYIRPQDLAYKTRWSHGPLIFLNACGTIGYTPSALSPFLKALVDGRGASGILGTEVPVAEYLAGEVALSFFRRFEKGESAGSALLEVRRELLGKKNPLGLVYTLFAAAALAIDVDGDGKCPTI